MNEHPAKITLSIATLSVVFWLAASSTAPVASESETVSGETSVEVGPTPQPVTGFRGSASCASANCHGAVTSDRNDRDDYVATAYIVWKYADPHAGSYWTLNSNLSKQIVTKLTGDEYDENAYHALLREHCYDCHAPAASTKNAADQFVTEGVGCEACHGKADQWLVSHIDAPGMAPGMKPTRPIADRGKVCVNCHVGIGAAGQGVNHDLIAAGHPRLNFEFRAYHDALPKHWQPSEVDRKSRLIWLHGQLASGIASLSQLDARLEPTSIWPEFAEFDCYSCHRTLEFPSGQSTTRFLAQSWYLDCLERHEGEAFLTPRGDVDVYDVQQLREFAREALTKLRNLQVEIGSEDHAVQLAGTMRNLMNSQTAPDGSVIPGWERCALVWLVGAAIQAEAEHRLRDKRTDQSELRATSVRFGTMLGRLRDDLHPPSAFRSPDYLHELAELAEQLEDFLEKTEQPE